MIIIFASHFCAAVVLDRQSGRVCRAAPILAYMVGWDRARVIPIRRAPGMAHSGTLGRL
jgi:hypothetical protein